MILDSQTNKVYISEQTLWQYPRITQRLLNALSANNVPYELLKHTNDVWCRDYMPIQIEENKFIKYRYFPDYLDNDRNRKYITNPTRTLKALGIETQRTRIVIDGGNVIKCPDCIIMTEKVFKENNHSLNDTVFIKRLERLFGCEILFLPWDKNEKYGHSDGIVRYIRDNQVLMTNYWDFDARKADEMYNRLSRRFNVHVLSYDVENPHKNNWAYINFLHTEQVIFVPAFGREEDAQALQQIARNYPNYKGRIFPVKVNGLVKDGGALNCITWNIKHKHHAEGTA